MSRTASFLGKDGSLSPFWRFVCITLTFLLFWPPICAIIGWWMKFELGSPLVGWRVSIAIYSYVICVPPALTAGIIHAVAAIGFHHNSILVPLVAAGIAPILIGADISLLGAVILQPVSLQGIVSMPMETYVLFFFASLIAPLVYWRVTRQFTRPA